jgi:hypothetical protein
MLEEIRNFGGAVSGLASACTEEQNHGSGEGKKPHDVSAWSEGDAAADRGKTRRREKESRQTRADIKAQCRIVAAGSSKTITTFKGPRRFRVLRVILATSGLPPGNGHHRADPERPKSAAKPSFLRKQLRTLGGPLSGQVLLALKIRCVGCHLRLH